MMNLRFVFGVELHKGRHIFTLQAEELVPVLGGLCGCKSERSQEGKDLAPDICAVYHVTVLFCNKTED